MDKEKKSIRLEVYSPLKMSVERRAVQISGEANVKLTEIQRATGLSAGYIVSQMIIQGAEFVDVVVVGGDR